MKDFKWERINYFLIPLLILDGLFRERSSLWSAVLLLIAMVSIPSSINVYKSHTRRKQFEQDQLRKMIMSPEDWRRWKDKQG